MMDAAFWSTIFLVFAVSFSYTLNSTLQLPITFNRLLQSAVKKGSLSTFLFETDTQYYAGVTFSDIIRHLDLQPRIEANKSIEGLVVLGAAAKSHGLTPNDFEYKEPSRWSINISVEDLANVSEKIFLPLNDTVTVMAIQEAMFRILEENFNFTIDEVSESLNKTKADVYSALEPGWIDVVHFIAKKKILHLAENYTIPPFYIAEALNMSLDALYNSTLPQLKHILKNKLDIIREAAKRLKQSSSVTGITTVSPSRNTSSGTSWIFNNTITTILSATPIETMTSYTEEAVPKGTIFDTNSPSHGTSFLAEKPAYTVMASQNKPTSTTHRESIKMTSPSVQQGPISQTHSQSQEITSTAVQSGSASQIQSLNSVITSLVTESLSSRMVTQNGTSSLSSNFDYKTTTFLANQFASNQTIDERKNTSTSLTQASTDTSTLTNTPTPMTTPTNSFNLQTTSITAPMPAPTVKITPTPTPIRTPTSTSTIKLMQSTTTQIHGQNETVLKTASVNESHSPPNMTSTQITFSKTNQSSTNYYNSSVNVHLTTPSTATFYTSSNLPLRSQQTTSSTNHTRFSAVSTLKEKVPSLHSQSVLITASQEVLSAHSTVSLSHAASSHVVDTTLGTQLFSSVSKTKTVITHVNASYPTNQNLSSTLTEITPFKTPLSTTSPLTTGNSTAWVRTYPSGHIPSNPNTITTKWITSTQTKQSRTTDNISPTSTLVLKTSLQKSPKVALSAISASWKSSTTVLRPSSTSMKYEITNTIRNSTVSNQHSTTTHSSTQSSDVIISRSYQAMRSSPSSMLRVVASSTSSVIDGEINKRSEDDLDPVILAIVPVTAVLVIVAIAIGIIVWLKRKREHSRAGRNNPESSSELSRKGLVESLENVNKSRTTNFVNRGAEDRPSRSVSRTSSISNLETIHEANEPEEPEIYDL